MTTRAQNSAIHALRTRLDLSEADYRGLLERTTGQTSSKDLSEATAERFLLVLKGCAGQGSGTPFRADRASGKYAPLLQALWISGHHLGLMADRSDTAMMRWLKREVGVSHTRFLIDLAEARRAVEALKKWLARGGVRWTAYPDDARGRKLAVLEAVAKALCRAGGLGPFLDPEQEPWPGAVEAYGISRGLPTLFDDYSDAEIIMLTTWLGESLWAARRMGKGGVQ